MPSNSPMKAGLKLHHLQKRAEVLFVHAVERDGAVGAAIFHQGRGRGAALGIHQLRQRPPGQRVERGQVEAALGNPARGGEFLDRPEGEHLVVGAFDVQLHLRVLIGGASAATGVWPVWTSTPARLRALPAIRPKAGGTRRPCPKLIRVRERHLDGLRFAGPDEPVAERRAQRDIPAGVRLPAEVRHAPGAAREFANIDADERRGQQAGGDSTLKRPPTFSGMPKTP